MRLNAEILGLPALKLSVTKVAIFATQGHFTDSFKGFLTYSHSRITAKKGLLSEEQMRKITEGVKPEGLSDKKSVAFDLALRLVKDGKPFNKRANSVLGRDQTLHVFQLVAYYSLHGITLNTGIIRAPEGESIWSS